MRTIMKAILVPIKSDCHFWIPFEFSHSGIVSYHRDSPRLPQLCHPSGTFHYDTRHSGLHINVICYCFYCKTSLKMLSSSLLLSELLFVCATTPHQKCRCYLNRFTKKYILGRPIPSKPQGQTYYKIFGKMHGKIG